MRLYGRYFSMHFRAAMEYKFSFVLTSMGQLFSSFTAFLSLYFLMDRFNAVAGFTFADVLLCFSVIWMAFALAECFFRGFDTFRGIISNGEFDRMMVRPRGLIFQVLCHKIEFTRIGRLAPAAAMFIYALPRCGVIWTGGKAATLTLMVLGGVVLFSALFLCYASICFFTTEGLEFMNIFTDGGREFGAYPLSVYGEGVLRFFTYAVPLACVQYYPLLFLLGKSQNPLYALTPLAAFAFAGAAYGFWRFAMRHYKSTGS